MQAVVSDAKPLPANKVVAHVTCNNLSRSANPVATIPIYRTAFWRPADN